MYFNKQILLFFTIISFLFKILIDIYFKNNDRWYVNILNLNVIYLNESRNYDMNKINK